MAKTKEQKKEMITNLEEKIKKMKSLVFIDYYGLKVKEVDQLRSLLKKKNCSYLVAKKTLLEIVLKKAGLDKIDLKKVQGGVGLVFGFDSEIEPAKLVVGFNKEHDKLKIQGGIFENNLIDAFQVTSLSKLPTKQELFGQLAGVMKGPINNFVYALKGNLKNIVYVLNAIKNKS